MHHHLDPDHLKVPVILNCLKRAVQDSYNADVAQVMLWSQAISLIIANRYATLRDLFQLTFKASTKLQRSRADLSKSIQVLAGSGASGNIQAQATVLASAQLNVMVALHNRRASKYSGDRSRDEHNRLMISFNG
jgi:hypothetical protein